ncbi:multiple inositol polyphosphate phosphatase, putative [Ixodes scapularis]|uniref:Multiple inositol polyphosphate phosphatase 1 n=1 Tax=Ixodes scapularis TaxID=6945 RepID=B7PBK5_IXOSC|nr:multiple inositol polyphosphate phosphatase, putative [Ixodes scapularis]|eukprot:XP_002408346.1 multiple inositol polyphosphate phosphatase, putative [Ixodes scapularis]
MEDIELMAKLCAFEVALKGSSPFCNLFRKEDLQLLEYAEDIELMAKLCAFEVALNGSSPFCNLFRKEDLELLEYAGDLDDYYKDGYGHERNSAQACGVIGEFVSRIE